MKDGRFTPKEKQRWRKRGYHIGACYKCGREFVYVNQTYLPAKKVWRTVCPKCKKVMGL